MVGKALFAQLTGNAPVAALVSTRVYPQAIPPGQAYPAIVYDISGRDFVRDVTPCAVDVTLNIVATTYAGVEDLATKVADAMHDQDGTWGGVVVQSSTLESDDETLAVVSAPTGDKFFVKQQQYLIWYER